MNENFCSQSAAVRTAAHSDLKFDEAELHCSKGSYLLHGLCQVLTDVHLVDRIHVHQVERVVVKQRRGRVVGLQNLPRSRPPDLLLVYSRTQQLVRLLKKTSASGSRKRRLARFVRPEDLSSGEKTQASGSLKKTRKGELCCTYTCRALPAPQPGRPCPLRAILR